jgi:lytic cellulose monooxygenase (C1-hydroxylating)
MLQASATGLAQQYDQCGGKNYSGPTQCTTDLECKFSNPYYSQCLRAGGAASVKQQWEQCGGRDYVAAGGLTGCANGLQCISKNPYYSQCLKI